MKTKHAVRKTALLFSAVIYVFASSSCFAETLEEHTVSEIEKSEADRVSDKATMPLNLLERGLVVAAKGLADHATVCQKGVPDFITVKFKLVSGFVLGAGLDLAATMTPHDSSMARISPLNKSSVTIFKNINNRMAGLYSWSANWDKGRKACSGNFKVSGTKCNVDIQFYEDCRDAGSFEY